MEFTIFPPSLTVTISETTALRGFFVSYLECNFYFFDNWLERPQATKRKAGLSKGESQIELSSE